VVSKKKTAAVGIPVALLLTIIGGMSLSLDFDFSNTNIGQIGDNIINQYFEDKGIDLDGFRELCDSGEVDEKFLKYCKLI